MTRRINHFIGAKSPEEGKNQALIAPWIWDMKGRFPDGKALDFSAWKVIPDIARPLLAALWIVVYEDSQSKTFGTTERSSRYFESFRNYLLERQPHFTKIGEINTQVLIDYRQWLSGRFKSNASSRCYRLIANLLALLRSERSPMPGVVSETLEIPAGSLHRVDYDEDPIEPYTRGESLAIERACRKLIWKKLALVNGGKQLLAKGTDPRLQSGGWLPHSNILWYIVHVLGGRYLGQNGLIKNKHVSLIRAANPSYRKPVGYESITVTQAYAYLYPDAYDLLPFLILLSIKTGLNLDSVMSLRRDCMQGESSTIPGLHRVRYRKGRGTMEEMERSFPSKGVFSPIGLIKTLLMLTEQMVPLVDAKFADKLFLCIRRGSHSENLHTCLETFESKLHSMINGAKNTAGVLEQFELKAADGEKLNCNFLRHRKTYHFDRYAEVGNLAHISKTVSKHHGKNGTNITATHYLANEATRPFHEQAVRDAQDAFYEEIMLSVVDVDDGDQDAVKTLADVADVTLERADRMLRGEQDVFVAQCKDFFNMPGGKPGAPCSNAWGCFECKNAVWTSRILPQVLAFKDFLEGQRSLLGEDDWTRKFETPWKVITYGILPRFSKERVEACRELSKNIALYVPPAMRAA